MDFYDRQLLTCVEIGKAVTSTLNMDEILVTILKRLSELIKAKNWTLYLLDQQAGELHFEVVVGLDTRRLRDVRIKLGEGIAGQAALTGEPIIVPEGVLDDPRFSRRVDELTGFTTRSLICLPLKIQHSVIGVLEVVNPEDPALFDESLMPVLSILADYVAIAIANARNYQEIEALSVTDDVTGFYNTRFLHQHLDGLLDLGRPVSLVFLDLDDFKHVVDSHGHLLGSKVLKEVAVVIASCLGEDDRLVRYGGDEYVVILPGQDKQAAVTRTREIRQALEGALFLRSDGLNLRISASFGIASYPQDAESKRELLQVADGCMYRSKQLGKNLITAA
jgi:diguanylate cyclase (GGDEF)-like protein